MHGLIPAVQLRKVLPIIFTPLIECNVHGKRLKLPKFPSYLKVTDNYTKEAGSSSTVGASHSESCIFTTTARFYLILRFNVPYQATLFECISVGKRSHIILSAQQPKRWAMHALTICTRCTTVSTQLKRPETKMKHE